CYAKEVCRADFLNFCMGGRVQVYTVRKTFFYCQFMGQKASRIVSANLRGARILWSSPVIFRYGKVNGLHTAFKICTHRRTEHTEYVLRRRFYTYAITYAYDQRS